MLAVNGNFCEIQLVIYLTLIRKKYSIIEYILIINLQLNTFKVPAISCLG